jgi:hypothetical protein
MLSGTTVTITPNGDNPLAGDQRSRVTSLRLAFSAPVHLADGAISLKLHPNVTITKSAVVTPNQFVGALPAFLKVRPVDGGLTWDVTFEGNLDAGGSIKEGVYDVCLKDGSGAEPVLSTFHRLFGELTGNGQVNTDDSNLFALAADSVSTDPNYRADCDLAGDGTINSSDANAFAKNFLTTWAY